MHYVIFWTHDCSPLGRKWQLVKDMSDLPWLRVGHGAWLCTFVGQCQWSSVAVQCRGCHQQAFGQLWEAAENLQERCMVQVTRRKGGGIAAAVYTRALQSLQSPQKCTGFANSAPFHKIFLHIDWRLGQISFYSVIKDIGQSSYHECQPSDKRERCLYAS